MNSESLSSLSQRSEACLEDVGFVGDFVAVEGHAGLEAEGVAGAEAAGDDAEFCTGFHDGGPDFFRGGDVGGDVDLEAVFAGVAGAGDEHVVDIGDLAPGEPVVLDGGEVDFGELLQGFEGARGPGWRAANRRRSSR